MEKTHMKYKILAINTKHINIRELPVQKNSRSTYAIFNEGDQLTCGGTFSFLESKEQRDGTKVDMNSFIYFDSRHIGISFASQSREYPKRVFLIELNEDTFNSNYDAEDLIEITHIDNGVVTVHGNRGVYRIGLFDGYSRKLFEESIKQELISLLTNIRALWLAIKLSSMK